MDIRSGQMLAWDSKIAEGLNTSDVPMEFCLLQEGVAEAFGAWRTGRVEIGQELADAAVHLFALAQMTGIDLQDELEARLPHAVFSGFAPTPDSAPADALSRASCVMFASPAARAEELTQHGEFVAGFCRLRYVLR